MMTKVASVEERLQKIIARAGVASRRRAEDLIRAGHVSVNGEVVRKLGSKADPDRDHVKVDGRLVTHPASKRDPKIYLLFNPEETSQDAYELQRLKAFLFATGRTPVPACITQQNCPDIPLKTCTDSDTMIYLHYSNESAITKQDNCILLQAEDTDPARVVNRFIYTIYGVMQ